MAVSAMCARLYRGHPPPAGLRRSGRRGELAGAQERLDHAAAETTLAFVGDGVLTGRHGALRLIEDDTQAAVRARLETRRLVALPVAHLGHGAKGLAPRRCEPV